MCLIPCFNLTGTLSAESKEAARYKDSATSKSGSSDSADGMLAADTKLHSFPVELSFDVSVSHV